MNRILSIDFLRGLVMLLMTIDHTRDMFSTVGIGEHLGLNLPWSYYVTRWITHFCAPTFVFLSGLSIALWLKKYAAPIRESQIHIIKRGLFIVLLDVTVASLLWTLIERQSVFTIYLAELWAIGGSMILLACLLNFSARTIFLIGLTIISAHNFFEPSADSTNLLTMLINGKGEFDLIPGLCHVAAGYPVLPWFGIACIGYSVGHYLINTKQSIQQQTRLFMLCILTSIILFIILRIFHLYGDSNIFIYQENNILMTLFSFFDVTKYPPSLHYTLITLLLSWLTLALRPYIENQAKRPSILVIKQFGQTPLFYYILHLTLIYSLFAILNVWLPESSIKSDHLFMIYGIALFVAMTAYPILQWFKCLREKYKVTFPILGYV